MDLNLVSNVNLARIGFYLGLGFTLGSVLISFIWGLISILVGINKTSENSS